MPINISHYYIQGSMPRDADTIPQALKCFFGALKKHIKTISKEGEICVELSLRTARDLWLIL